MGKKYHGDADHVSATGATKDQRYGDASADRSGLYTDRPGGKNFSN